MQRFKNVLGLALLAAAVALGAWLWWDGARHRSASGGSRAVPREERSLLLITVDTTRADHLEPYGSERVATPNLARLAEAGVVFEQAQSVAPITLVAHTSILTGLYPPRHGVRNNGTHYVSEGITTLAERLRSAGYRTAAFVSAAVLESRYGLDQGFELYDDDLSAGRERRPRVVPDRPATATVAAASRWLDSLADGERYFLWVHFYDPHAGYSPPPPFRDDYYDSPYAGEIAYMDSELGHLLAHPRLRRDSSPLVAVIGDHGESLGEHGEQTHAILAYEATMHVPWLLRIPGGPRGLRIPEPVSQVDLVPTLLELLDQPEADDLDGRSLVPQIEGIEDAAPVALYGETYLPYYTYGWAKLRVLRQGRWKLIEAPRPELFDLHRDPRELADQFDREPGIRHDLQRALEGLTEAFGDADREASLELDTEAAEKLRSLGYLSVGSRRPEETSDRADPKDVISNHVGLERARYLMQDRLYEAAVRQLREVLDADPGNLAALTELATALDMTGKLDEASAVAEQALAIDPGYSRLQLLLATIEVRRGQVDRAFELLDLALAADARNREAIIQKAALLRRLQRGAEAGELLAAALADEPDDPRLNTQYARIVEAEAGDLGAAESRLRKALARDPWLALAWRYLGEVLESSGRPEEAVESYLEGLRRQPDHAELHGRAGLLLAKMGSGAEAEVHLREALRLSSEFRPDLLVALGAWLSEHGRPSEAEVIYEQVLAVDPTHPAARNNRGIALYRSGRLDEAEAELLRLVQDFPGQADAHNNLAALAIDRRDFGLALQRAQRAARLQPAMPEAQNNLGLALSGLGRATEAVTHFRTALELDSTYWPARLNLGLELKATGRYEEAASVLTELLETLPWHAEAHLELAEIYAGPLPEPELARDHFNAFLRRSPGHPRAAEVRRRVAALPPPA